LDQKKKGWQTKGAAKKMGIIAGGGGQIKDLFQGLLLICSPQKITHGDTRKKPRGNRQSKNKELKTESPTEKERKKKKEQQKGKLINCEGGGPARGQTVIRENVGSPIKLVHVGTKAKK